MIEPVAAKRADTGREDGISEVAIGVGVAITLAMAGTAGVIHSFGSDSGERSITGPWPSLAFTAVIAAPAVVAVIGTMSRPWVLGGAGVAQVPMMWLSFSPLFFPLLVPAVLFITQGSSMARGPRRSWAQPLAAAASALFLVAAPLCLIVHQDPTSWTMPNGGSGYSSNVTTATESALSFLCVVAAVVAAIVAPPDSD